MRKPVPVIDLFSGPGGLAEGFAKLQTKGGRSRYRIELSIEMDEVAHRTLRLRAFLRKFRDFPDEYYEYVNGLLPSEPGRRRPLPRGATRPHRRRAGRGNVDRHTAAARELPRVGGDHLQRSSAGRHQQGASWGSQGCAWVRMDVFQLADALKVGHLD